MPDFNEPAGNPASEQDLHQPSATNADTDTSTSTPSTEHEPVDETPVPTIRVGAATTAPATTIAYTHDILLELVAPNWQTTIWKAERPVKNGWFNGRNPNVLKVH